MLSLFCVIFRKLCVLVSSTVFFCLSTMSENLHCYIFSTRWRLISLKKYIFSFLCRVSVDK